MLLFCLSILIFAKWPALDLAVSGIYYTDNGFFLEQNGLVVFVYNLFGELIQISLLLFVVGLLFSFFTNDNTVRKQFLFLIVCALLGPGILVNTVLKDNSSDRPRPRAVIEFGGESIYSPPFAYSGACDTNCSFVSGHASSGFYWMCLFWLTRRKKWIGIGIGLGMLSGGVRIIQGGHFLSDVVFAGWACYFSFMLIAHIMAMREFKLSEPYHRLFCARRLFTWFMGPIYRSGFYRRFNTIVSESKNITQALQKK